MTLFGRDSVLTAWMALLNGPDLAFGALQTLAELQGADVNPTTEEEPGRIVHEVRYDQQTSRVLGGRSAYYGTADATPLFVMLVGELARWGASREQLSPLLPHVDRALAWVEDFGDRDGDGYVEYLAATPTGLRNQGWKDSWDAIRYRSGAIAAAPLAVAEVQGYTYAAYLARAELADLFGDPDVARRCRRRASRLKERFNDDFWVDTHGWYAMALDGDKAPVDALASNIGHCLWTGIVDDDRAAVVAAQLASPAMWSGFGLRTLASSMPGYNPLSYHCGSVWPHDTAIAVAGLVRYRQDAAASRLARGLLDASRWYDGRLPELFGGFGRDDLRRPVRYPASCSPQAWASAAPLLLARSLIGLEPRLGDRVARVRWTPVEGVGHLRLNGLVMGGNRISIDASSERIVVDGLPDGMRVELA
jgi:glycogen debranching enzyme